MKEDELVGPWVTVHVVEWADDEEKLHTAVYEEDAEMRARLMAEKLVERGYAYVQVATIERRERFDGSYQYGLPSVWFSTEMERIYG